MSGFEVCRRIREHPSLRNTVVFFLSANGNPGSKAQAIALEVKEYILKPFTPREILEKVRYHLSTPEPPPPFLSLAFLVGVVSRLAHIGLWTRMRSAGRKFKRPQVSLRM
jgi:DNA-binding response OmpR family regulator